MLISLVVAIVVVVVVVVGVVVVVVFKYVGFVLICFDFKIIGTIGLLGRPSNSSFTALTKRYLP